MDDIIVGLDIGTTKTCAVIGFLNENNQTEIAGVGVAPSTGLRKGIIVNIDSTAVAIGKAVEQAESMALHEVTDVYAGISGNHIKGQNSKGVVAVTNRNRSIGKFEMKKVIEAAQAIVVPVDRQIMHVLSKEFAVDGQGGIKEPEGMSGVRLEAEVHIVTGAVASIQNLMKSVQKAGFRYQDIVFNPLASAESVLTHDEMELGVVLLDIGGGTTDILVFLNGGIEFSSVLSVGGLHVTNDIAQVLRTPVDSAEIIKKKHGCASLDLVDPSEMIEVPSVGPRPPRSLFKQELTQIISQRMEEIFELVDAELNKSGKKGMLAAGGGIVLTGGGSMLSGSIEAAEKIFNMPARIGEPRDIVNLKDEVSTPEFSNSVGLLKYGIKMSQFRGGGKYGEKERFLDRVKKWFDDYL